MKVAIFYYSTYGHIVKMAEAVKAGVDKAGLASETQIFQIPETLPSEVLTKMHAPPKADYPLATAQTLLDYDAFFFGIPTRYGNVPAQISTFLDRTGGIWAKGALTGKPVSLFVSTGTPGGGQETTLRNFLTYIAHHGMVFVPLGYAKAFPQLTSFDEVHGGSPYGAGCYAGPDGSRQPSALELEIATIQGEQFPATAIKFLKTELAPAQEAAVKETTPTNEVVNEKATEAKVPEARTAQTKPATEDKSSGCARCTIV